MRKTKFLGVLLLLCSSEAALAAVRIVEGPTPIPQGEARAIGDMTVINDRLAFALAVASAVPYGVPRGALVDLAPVVDGVIGRDCVVFADFIPDNWSAWPNTYQHVEILERGPERAVIRAVRDWGKVTITTVYTLEADADSVAIKTTMSNTGDTALEGLLSGMTLWPRRGFLFAVPLQREEPEGKMESSLSDRVVAYDEDFSVALHAPYADTIGDGSMDLYLKHTLRPGQTREFDALLQVGSSGDLQPVIKNEMQRKHLDSGVVRGKVVAVGGHLIRQPVIIVERSGKPYGWIIGKDGRYQAALPVGEYVLHASARNYSQSARMAVRIEAGGALSRDFTGLKSPGHIQFLVLDARSGAPLDARISIAAGPVQVVQFLGRTTFFTELDRKGRLDVPMAPGNYQFKISAGGGFLSKTEQSDLRVVAGSTTPAKIAVTPLFAPPSKHWYSADLHHHADQAEAVTPPQDLARSQFAAGLDVLFVGDHDSTKNHGVLQAIADRRGVAFIPGIEMSPSWGHFNAYPLRPGETFSIDMGSATVDNIFAEARRHGATVIQVNHPFIPYGYFTSVTRGVAPGGFDPGFDLLEINAAAADDDAKVLHALWDFWNRGQRYYLSGGTDTHNVWNEESGSVRVFAHLEGPVSAAAFAQALKSGHAYVTSGPLVFPSVVFGDELTVHPGEPASLGFDLAAVAGVAQVDLIAAGDVLKSETFLAAPAQIHVDYSLSAQPAAWYALIVRDARGHKAYTNPIWVVTQAANTAVRH